MGHVQAGQRRAHVDAGAQAPQPVVEALHGGARVLVGSLRGAFDFDGEKLRSADVSGFAARIDSGGHVGAASL
jgi:hypothetical protein